MSERVLDLSRKDVPQCNRHSVANTEIADVFSDGRSAQEIWTVEACGRRSNYVVTFPPKKQTGASLGFTVRPER